MQFYKKISFALKIVKKITLICLIIYILFLSTNTIFYLANHSREISLNHLIDIKKFTYNTYKITFIMMLFVVGYSSVRNKYSFSKIVSIIGLCLLFLPISILLNYNFTIMNSLMRSFYLVVIIAVMVIIIDFLTKKIDELYSVAVGSKDETKKGKGEKNYARKNAR